MTINPALGRSHPPSPWPKAPSPSLAETDSESAVKAEALPNPLPSPGSSAHATGRFDLSHFGNAPLRVCANCGTQFEPRASGKPQKYCNPDCLEGRRRAEKLLGRQAFERHLRRRARESKSQKVDENKTAIAEALKPLPRTLRIARRLLAAGHDVQFEVRLFVDGRAKTIDQAAQMPLNPGRNRGGNQKVRSDRDYNDSSIKTMVSGDKPQNGTPKI